MAQRARVLNDRYEIEDHLGRGGMAEVYRGTDRVLGRPVAIKLLDRRYRDDAKFVTRFRREAQSAAGINHPNVVSIYDTGSEDGTHYIVMEFVDGETLDQVLTREKRLSPARAMAIAEPVARALDAAHQKGMVHRDVKPGNIMIDREGTVKVVDFGIARAAADDTLTQTGIVLGTAAYLSPEQAQGEPVDPRSDVYSLGCVLYEALTGRKPFEGDSPLAIAYKHVREPPTPPSQLQPDVPPELEAVVMRALAKDPDQRFESGGAMREALSAAATGEMPALAGPTEPLARRGDTAVLPTATEPQEEPVAGGPPRRWVPWVVIAAIVVALIVLLFLALGNQGPGPSGENAPTTAAPTETPPQQAPADPVARAYQDLVAVLGDGVASGGVSDTAAQEIQDHAEEAVAAYAEGDGETAARESAEAYASMLEGVERGEISEDWSPQIETALFNLADAMGVSISAPEEGDEGDEGEDRGSDEGNGDGHGPPPHAENDKGKDKDKGRD